MRYLPRDFLLDQYNIAIIHGDKNRIFFEPQNCLERGKTIFTVKGHQTISTLLTQIISSTNRISTFLLNIFFIARKTIQFRPSNGSVSEVLHHGKIHRKNSTSKECITDVKGLNVESLDSNVSSFNNPNLAGWADDVITSSTN